MSQEGWCMARVLDGTAIAAAIKAEVRAEVERLAPQGIRPGLAAVLVGHVPASEIYVRSKVKTCEALGLFSELITPPETVTTEEMLALISQLNAREDIDGILIQLPLPAQVNAKLLLEAVSPDKDVDGFHPVNVGRLQTGQPALAPCTAAGIIEILKRSHLQIAGQNAVVVGRSDIVGKPTAILLLAENATVTVCHSRTRDLASFTRRADILVVAIGKPAFVTAEMVKPGARFWMRASTGLPIERSSSAILPGMLAGKRPSCRRVPPLLAMCFPKHLHWRGPIRPCPAALGR